METKSEPNQSPNSKSNEHQPHPELRDLADAIPNLVWMTDKNGTVDYINQQCLQFTGASSFEEGLEQWLDALHEDDRAESYARWSRSLNSGSTFEKEYRLKRHDGVYHWFLGRAVPVRDSNNQIQRWIGTATDIEKQKRLFNDLQQSRDQLEFILGGITDGVTAFNRDGKFIYANIAGAKMCGFNTVEEMLAAPNDKIMDQYLLYDEMGKPFPIEKLPGRLALKGVKNPTETILQVVRKDTGKRSWSIVSAAPILDDNGDVLYAVSIFRDFTIHKENENSLRNRESTFRLIAETGVIFNSSLDYNETLQKLCELVVPLLSDWCLVDVIVDSDAPKTISWHWNPDKRKWFESYQTNFRPDWRASVEVSQVITTGTPVCNESVDDDRLAATAKSPAQLAALKSMGISSAMVVPMIANKKVLGAITLISSESKRKFTNLDLTLAEDIGRRAGMAIDKALLYESERKAREQAENANNYKSTFLANMSHEIRTPLNALIGFNELLRSDALSKEERADYHNIIQRNGELLLHLIDDILDLSKVEAGHLTLETVTISLRELLNEISAFKKANAASKGLQFILETQGSLPEAFVTDPLRLKQILNNIIGNAIKFTSEGHIKTVVHLDASRNRLIFNVSDTGIGIPRDVRDKLFQPFTQADASVTRRYGGTGLGLVLSKRLAQRLGGDLFLKDSPDGQGAEFVIEIASNLQANSAVEQSVSMPEKSLEGRRILVVDDSIDNQVLIEHILKSRGAIVDTAENGQIGMDKAWANNYDIVLMDVQMPVLDGHSATRQLRAKNYSRPIIGLTAHAMQEDRRRCLEAGCTDYLTKPIRTEVLIQTISRHIN